MPQNHKQFYSANGRRQILIVDDEIINREILGNILKADYDITYAENGAEALRIIGERHNTLSLVLLDLIMPEVSGREVLQSIKEDPELRRIPVIVMTSDTSAEVESLQLGAIDFITKPYQANVVRMRVLRTIELSEDRQIIQSTERDALTGLFNREYFYRYAEQFDVHHGELPMDAIVFDINHFHMINERYGRAYGDNVLRRVSEKLLDLVNEQSGMACRSDGDTFMLYRQHADDYDALLERVSNGFGGDDTPTGSRIRLRMGVYADVDKSIDIERRFDRAKNAADTVRGSFVKAVSMYDETLHESEMYTEQLVDDFEEAIAQRQFKVFYQPKFDVRTEPPRLASAEALVRWQHPRLGMISPGVFIPLFEENGLIQRLDYYVWREAAAQINRWKRRFGISLPVSVNVSRIDMFDANLVPTFEGILTEYGLSHQELVLEITESAYTNDAELIIASVKQLRSVGFKIEMDDFGTGYSSLGMISRLPIDALKLDMTFVRNAFNEHRDVRMLELIIDISDYIGVPVIAEGVETEEQMNALRDMGCDLVQGYYFSKPVPADEFERFINERVAADAASAQRGETGDAAPAKEMSAEAEEALAIISAALTSDFEYMYYVDVDTGYFMELSTGKHRDGMRMQRGGSDFFGDMRTTLLSDVYFEDAPDAALALQRDHMAEKLSASKQFQLNYRRVIGGETVYYNMRIVRAKSMDDGHVLIAISNVDSQMQREIELEKARSTSQIYARVAQALTRDYYSIYDVNADTYAFVEYSSHSDYQGLNVEQSGSDFFAYSVSSLLGLTYPDDLEKALDVWEKSRLLAQLSENDTVSVVYRMMLSGEPRYVNVKVTRMAYGEGDNHIVIGLSNADAQMRREQELNAVREQANRDSLTHVRSRLAFDNDIIHMNEQIASGELGEFAVVACGVNYLKRVNDTLGHIAGSEYLKLCCSLICHIFDHSPVYRTGGDEFTVILQGRDYANRRSLQSQLWDQLNGISAPLAIGESNELMRQLRALIDAIGVPVIAFGCSDFGPGIDHKFTDVYDRADSAMYACKSAMKNGE